MANYLNIPIETDPYALSADALDYLIENVPGFVPREGHLEVWLIEVWARMVSEARIVAAQVPTEIFKYFGQTLLGLTPVAAVRATATTTWVMADTQGYTIPADTVVAFRTAGDELIPFRTVQDVTIPAGSDTHANITVEALEPGAQTNGLGPEAVELVDAFAFVDTVTANEETSGGVDAETTDEYLDRLATELQLFTPRPILEGDFAVLARRTPNVHRAQAFDGYDPITETNDNARMITVVPVDAQGQSVGSETHDELQANLDVMREVNFIVHTMDPEYTPIEIVYDVVAEPNVNPADLEADIDLALTQMVSPANFAGGNESPPTWRPTEFVRFSAVIGTIVQVPGVAYVRSLTLNGAGDDVALANSWTLPAPFDDPGSPSSVAGTVTESVV